MFRREKGRVNGWVGGRRDMWMEGWMIRRKNWEEDGWNERVSIEGDQDLNE